MLATAVPYVGALVAETSGAELVAPLSQPSRRRNETLAVVLLAVCLRRGQKPRVSGLARW